MYELSPAVVNGSLPIGHAEFQLSSPSIHVLEEKVEMSEKSEGTKKMLTPCALSTSTKATCQPLLEPVPKVQYSPAKVDTSTLPLCMAWFGWVA